MALAIVRIPKERIGALIGKDGETKKLLEQRTGTSIRIDSVDGDVEIDASKCTDPSMSLVVPSIVKAIGRGFNPDLAMELLDGDDMVLEMLDIRDYVGKKPNHVERVRARIIGAKGKTRRILEDLTGTHISVFGNTVGVIGGSVQVSVAIRALDLLISGAEHATVYRFLERKRGLVRIAEMGFD